MFVKYLNNHFLTLIVIPFLLGTLTVFSFQPYNLTLLNFFILPIIFYLIIFIKKKSKSTYRKKPFKRNLFIFGTAFGFGFFLSGLHWIVNSLTFDESFKILIPFGLILIPLFLSLFFSIAILLIGPFLNYNINSIILFSGTLGAVDYVRSKVLTGFPWNLWSYSYSWALEILQILNVIGLFAFNLITISLFMLPAIIFCNSKLTKKFFYLSMIPVILLALYIYGNHSINHNQYFLNKIDKKINIKVISPNFELNYGLSDEDIKERLSRLIKYSDPEKNLKTLFVWPEGVFSGYSYNQLSNLKDIFHKNFSENHLILFGVNILDKKKGGFFNSLIIVNNRFEKIYEYKKQKLVPFGEFLPLEKILNKFGLKKITEGHGSFLKGRKQNNFNEENVSMLPLICYEIIFPKLSQKSPKGTNLIINISEDGWFGDSIGPHQHFSKAIFRAIEQNLFLVRSANKGISAIINNKGEIIKNLKLDETGNINHRIPLIETNKKNKNDLIFFVLLFTYILIFNFYKKIND